MSNNKTGGSEDIKDSIKTVYVVIGTLVTIFLALFGWQLACGQEQDRKIESINTTYTDIQARLASIETNILWIKGNLK